MPWGASGVRPPCSRSSRPARSPATPAAPRRPRGPAGPRKNRAGSGARPVAYTGVVSDAFREGREVIVNVRKQGATFVGERDSLVTKCPSKFVEDATQNQKS